MDSKHGEKAIERASSIADQAARAIHTQHHTDRCVPLSLRSTECAGEATRQNAAETLRAQARRLRSTAQTRLQEARDAMVAIEKTHADAQRALHKAHALEVLADEAAHLRGPAEQALWELALQRETNGV